MWLKKKYPQEERRIYILNFVKQPVIVVLPRKGDIPSPYHIEAES